jgi:hypothetical protein
MTGDLRAIEQHLKVLKYLDDRLGEAVFDLKHDENLDLPVAIQRDLAGNGAAERDRQARLQWTDLSGRSASAGCIGTNSARRHRKPH